jgi:hypothetical protein
LALKAIKNILKKAKYRPRTRSEVLFYRSDRQRQEYDTVLGIELPEGSTKNITTVEDPVEYRLGGINQIQIKPDIDLDFALCLPKVKFIGRGFSSYQKVVCFW